MSSNRFHLQDAIHELAESRHAERCARPERCTDGWHVRNDYLAKAARDIIAIAEAEIDAMRRKYIRYAL